MTDRAPPRRKKGERKDAYERRIAGERAPAKPPVRKKGGGRPVTKGPALAIQFKNFTCVAANAVAQVFIRHTDPRPDTRKEERQANDPTRHLARGTHFVLFTKATVHGPVTQAFPPDEAEARALSREDAEFIARGLWNGADEEDRFGTLDGAESHILYRNRYFEVWFSPKTDIRQPFVVVHTSTGNVLIGETNRPRLFRTLQTAMEAADKIEKELLA